MYIQNTAVLVPLDIFCHLYMVVSPFIFLMLSLNTLEGILYYGLLYI